MMCRSLIVLLSLFSFLSHSIYSDETPKLPIGMNIPSYNHHTPNKMFMDVMKSASSWITFNPKVKGWSTNKADELQLDEQGYPLELPFLASDGTAQAVKFLINNKYKGVYKFLYDGVGEFRFNVKVNQENGVNYLVLDGKGGNKWINILSSKKGDHIRNIRIIPLDIPEDSVEIFHPLFLEGLKPFHCLRFMDTMKINGSKQTIWETRSRPDNYSQGLDNGVAIEYLIELCNVLNCDAWFCVPHQADDDYIRQFAQLVRDTLNPELKVYIEYSNEIWNWMFSQSHYVLNNAPGAKDLYVQEDLKKINPGPSVHPEKDAYMMQRVFNIWSEEFGQESQDRFVRVAPVQFVWVDNTRRILEYLFKTDENGQSLTSDKYSTSTGQGCDVVAATGYFGYEKTDHERWLSMSPESVTPELIMEAVEKKFDSKVYANIIENVDLVRKWGVDYIVYEGGQHVQPFQQKEWPYNQAIWDAQIDPRMYQMYMKVFKTHASDKVNCKLFCAYNYVGNREQKWGSWGHLESLDQLLLLDEINDVAPKYGALLDANLQKSN